ncbi:substrate-binding domain-containing protein [Kaistia geumhonensis]|uniref:Ribose transport system substrate-binding protein n=1 Tax=Kaistia geumhonensis TaxID=410839 RepID=A0ABU0M8W3_9HYPH|nr:substrate-binding domain-containing protein [Kaistia geumhonensis]MCX5477548.1 substrate-binding domain-containing protein [Kaistia geumhonensis]MDQ0517245.1 ribose transport system substrate-binding protein [Kaistia geumhonensis]
MKLKATLVALATATAALAAAPPAMAEGKPYKIYLSNNFVGNDWRQQMERVAEVSVKKGPLAGRVDLKIENVEGTVQAQINSLNNIIRSKPDAILIDAASAEALNPTIKKACDAGIVVISFDQVVSEPCAYALESDWTRIPAVLAEWMASQLNGKGKVFVDRGLAGAPISAQLEKGYLDVLAKYPGIEVIGNYNGEYALGPEQAGVASLLAAHPEVDGILTQGYGSGAIKALQDAGRKIVPVTAFSYNVAATTCAQTEGAACILGSNPAYLSSEAIKLAVDILDGKPKPADRHILVNGDFLATNGGEWTSTLYPDAVIQKIEIGKNAWPDRPPGLTLPITPEWVEITAEEAAGG